MGFSEKRKSYYIFAISICHHKKGGDYEPKGNISFDVDK